jgi:hypothetical protein
MAHELINQNLVGIQLNTISYTIVYSTAWQQGQYQWSNSKFNISSADKNKELHLRIPHLELAGPCHSWCIPHSYPSCQSHHQVNLLKLFFPLWMRKLDDDQIRQISFQLILHSLMLLVTVQMSLYHWLLHLSTNLISNQYKMYSPSESHTWLPILTRSKCIKCVQLAMQHHLKVIY